MPRPNESHVYFGVFDFGNDLDAVTKIMGVAPTSAWLEGDPLPNEGSAKRTHSRWDLRSGLDLTAPIEDHLAALLAILESRKDAVAMAMARFTVEIAVAAYFYEVNPGFSISSSLAQRLAALGVDVHFDLYCLVEE